MSFSLFRFRHRAAETCNTKNERKQKTSKKHYEIKDKETSKVKRCGDKTGEGTFTFGKMPGRGNRRKPDDDDDDEGV